MKAGYILLIISIWVGFLGFGQTKGPSPSELERFYNEDVTEELQLNETDSLIAWQERVLLHIDNSTIDKNRPLFFKGYVLTGPNRVRATLSKVLKVDLIRKADSSVVATQYHRIDSGMTEGSLVLPDKMEPGRYLLRAYTRWMENYGADAYFTRELRIASDKERAVSDRRQVSKKSNTENLRVRFYPEGERLVTGLENRLLIRAIDQTGEIIGTEGAIVNNLGVEISPVVVFENGIMVAYFTPEPGEAYKFRTSGNQNFDIPAASNTGYVLHVSNLKEEALNLRIQATQSLRGEEVWITGKMNGVTYFQKPLKLKGDDTRLEISKNGIPSGILDITLKDASGEEWAIRPVFIDPDNALNIAVTPLEDATRKNERAFRVRVTDAEGIPVETSIALSATHLIGSEATDPGNPGADFLWEMHGADLPGRSMVRTDRFIKDLELLTSGKGWGSQIPSSITYPFQRGLDLIGYAYDLNNELLRDAHLKLLISTEDDLIIREVRTDESGRLEVENLQIEGETEMIFRTEGDDTSTRLVKVIPVQEAYDQEHRRKAVLAIEKQRNRETIISSPWEPLDSNELIELDAVEVFEQKVERPRSVPPTYGTEAIQSRTKEQDLEAPRFLFQLFAEIPGLIVSGATDADLPKISILSTNNTFGATPPNAFGSTLDQTGPLWVIDGFIWGNASQVEPEMGLDAWSIDRIELLVGAEAAIYGTRAARGVIMIYTRNGSELEVLNRKEGRLYFKGYQETPDFESYSKLLAKRPRKFADRPTTVFWNPRIETDENGEALVRFKMPFETNRLKIKASAITPEGEIASAQQYFD